MIDAIIPSIISGVTSTHSLLLLMFLLVITGMLVPRWRYNELRDELDEYKQSTKSILTQLQEVSAQIEGSRTNANSPHNPDGGD